MYHRSRHVPGRLAAVLLAASALGAAVVVAPTSAAVSCAVAWGSTHESVRPPMTLSPITNVRAGQQECYDRLVIDIAGGVTGYDVSYVAEVGEVGSGEVVPLRGGAKLQVIVFAPSYDADYRPTYSPANPDELVDIRGYRTLRQAATAGSFEGETTLGLGVRARLPFRVFTLTGPGTNSRIVVDVAHRW